MVIEAFDNGETSAIPKIFGLLRERVTSQPHALLFKVLQNGIDSSTIGNGGSLSLISVSQFYFDVMDRASILHSILSAKGYRAANLWLCGVLPSYGLRC